jgi:hypothetical protein
MSTLAAAFSHSICAVAKSFEVKLLRMALLALLLLISLSVRELEHLNCKCILCEIKGKISLHAQQ